MRYLRAAYAVPDRYGKPPRPPVFTLRLASGGIVKATLDAEGVRYEAGLPPASAAALELDDPTDEGDWNRSSTKRSRARRQTSIGHWSSLAKRSSAQRRRRHGRDSWPSSHWLAAGTPTATTGSIAGRRASSARTCSRPALLASPSARTTHRWRHLGPSCHPSTRSGSNRTKTRRSSWWRCSGRSSVP